MSLSEIIPSTRLLPASTITSRRTPESPLLRNGVCFKVESPIQLKDRTESPCIKSIPTGKTNYLYLGLLNDPSLYATSRNASTSDIVDFVAHKERKNLVQVAMPERKQMQEQWKNKNTDKIEKSQVSTISFNIGLYVGTDCVKMRWAI